jgi:hypothetical protein
MKTEMREEMLTEIERINVIILAIGCLAATVIMRDFRYVFSFGVGSANMTLNFRFLRKGIEGTFLKAQASKQVTKKALIIKLPLKFLALVTAVTLVVLYGDIDVIFFLVGLSTVFISIMVSQIFALKPADERSKQHGA